MSNLTTVLSNSNTWNNTYSNMTMSAHAPDGGRQEYSADAEWVTIPESTSVAHINGTIFVNYTVNGQNVTYNQNNFGILEFQPPSPKPTQTLSPTSTPSPAVTSSPALTPSPSVPEFPAWTILPITLTIAISTAAVAFLWKQKFSRAKLCDNHAFRRNSRRKRCR